MEEGRQPVMCCIPREYIIKKHASDRQLTLK